MLSISPARTAAGAQSYYMHMREKKEDYYAKEGVGQWHGAGAEALGLNGEVSAKDFAALSLGFNPKDGEALVQNAGNDDRRAGWDLTFSAPKSASICWALGDEATRNGIEEAHAEAVKIALDLLQEKAGIGRFGTDGRDREAAALVFATFQHGTSRELDPQLHTHSFVFNQAMREDGKWASLDSKGFYEWKMAAGALYRASMAEKLREKGYTIERDGDSFRVAGVPKALEEHFSQRRSQILEALQEKGYTSAAAAAAANLDTRKAKGDIELDKLQHEWSERAKAMGFERQHAQPGIEHGPQLAMASAPEIMDKAVEMDALVKEQQIYAAAFREAQGAVDVAEARRIAEQAIQGAVRFETERGARYSTHELVRQEREVIESARARNSETSHQVPTATMATAIADIEARKSAEMGKSFAYSPEQKSAIAYLTGGSGGVATMIGDAGTGKSTTLEAVREVFEAAGFEVRGCAIQGKTEADLQASTGINSTTVEKLTREIERGNIKLDAKTVLIVEEAGMVGSRDWHKLDKACREAGAKLIQSGDNKQIQAVAAGGVFRHVAEVTNATRLTQIVRQHEEWRREAVRQMSRGEAAKALTTYIDKGLVSVKSTHKAACTEAVKLHEENVRAVGQEKAVMIASTNAQVNTLNEIARERLIERGDVANRQAVKINEGQKTINLGEGDRVMFRAAVKGHDLKNGDLATVKAIEGGDLKISVDRTKQEITIKAATIEAMRHGYAMTAHKSQGISPERVVGMGSANLSREMTYVIDSRAKDTTKWVFTQHHVKQMAEKAPPSEKMLQQAQRIEAQRLERGEKPALADEQRQSFAACREYLNQHGDQQIERKPALDPRLDEIKEIVGAMSESRQKETTLDYTPHMPPPEGPKPPVSHREGPDFSL